MVDIDLTQFDGVDEDLVEHLGPQATKELAKLLIEYESVEEIPKQFIKHPDNMMVYLDQAKEVEEIRPQVLGNRNRLRKFLLDEEKLDEWKREETQEMDEMEEPLSKGDLITILVDDIKLLNIYYGTLERNEFLEEKEELYQDFLDMVQNTDIENIDVEGFREKLDELEENFEASRKEVDIDLEE